MLACSVNFFLRFFSSVNSNCDIKISVGDGLQGEEAGGVSAGAEAVEEEQGCVPGVLLQVRRGDLSLRSYRLIRREPLHLHRA